MKNKINREFLSFKRSRIKTIIFSIVIVIFTLAISLAVFVYTPLIRSLGIVGENKIIPTKRVFDNIISLEAGESVNEIIFKYFVDKQQGEAIDYNKIIRTLTLVDSLNNEVELWRAYAYNISQIIDGTKKPISADSIMEIERKTGDVIATRSALDTLLRNQVTTQLEKLEAENTIYKKHKIYPPINGQITTHFNYKQKINGVTISTNKVAPVMSVGEGTIVSSIWTPEDGYIVQIQHPDNFISIYKGITRPLKRVGERVSARGVIGYIGGNNDENVDTLINVLNPQNTNSLYFELWQNGNVIDPEKYIIF